MKFKALIGTALLACASFGAAAHAAETTYDCTASYKSRDGFVGPRIVFFVDENAGTVRVIDGMIQSVKGGPITGEIKSTSEKAYQIAWKVTAVPTNNGELDVPFKATLNRKSHAYRMTAVGFNHHWRPRGEGSCKVSR